jgi:acyl carrier protein
LGIVEEDVMTMENEDRKISQLVERSIESVNESGIVDEKVILEDAAHVKRPEGPFDSLALVALIAALEEAIESELGVMVSLAAGLETGSQGSPFETVGSVKRHVTEVVRAAQQ